VGVRNVTSKGDEISNIKSPVRWNFCIP